MFSLMQIWRWNNMSVLLLLLVYFWQNNHKIWNGTMSSCGPLKAQLYTFPLSLEKKKKKKHCMLQEDDTFNLSALKMNMSSRRIL